MCLPKLLALGAALLLALGCDPSPDEIVAAARAGDVETVRRGLSPTGPHLDRALREGIESGHVDVVQVLLEGGVSPAFTLAEGEVTIGSEEMFEALEPHVRGFSPYLCEQAVRAGHADVVARLVAGAPPARLGEPAAVAIRQHRPAALAHLIGAGADPGMAYLEALEQPDMDAIRVILEEEESERFGLEVAFLSAVTHDEAVNRADVVDLLLERGLARPRMLTFAAGNGRTEVVRRLLAHGEADVDTALLGARRAGHADVVAVLEAHVAAHSASDATPASDP